MSFMRQIDSILEKLDEWMKWIDDNDNDEINDINDEFTLKSLLFYSLFIWH